MFVLLVCEYYAISHVHLLILFVLNDFKISNRLIINGLC